MHPYGYMIILTTNKRTMQSLICQIFEESVEGTVFVRCERKIKLSVISQLHVYFKSYSVNFGVGYLQTEN